MFNNFKITSAEQLTFYGLLGLLGSAIVSTAQAELQFLTTHKAANIGVAVSYGLTTFLIVLGGLLYSYVPGHIQQLIQTLQDANAQLQAENQALKQQSVPVAAPVMPTATPAPLVVVHNMAATPMTATPTSVAPASAGIAPIALPVAPLPANIAAQTTLVDNSGYQDAPTPPTP